MKESITIPPAFKKFFWDSDFLKLKLPEHENYILNKLMIYGDIESIKWIIQNFDRGTVNTYLSTKGKFALDKKSYLFWNTITNMEDLWR